VLDDKGLEGFGRLLREYHDAVAGFRPPADTVWAFGPASCREGEVICHGDFGPWNIVWRDNEPVGILDWDFARPGRPERDVAYAAEYVAPFRNDEHCLRWLQHPQPPDRRRRLERFCAAYGLASAEGMVDAVLREQLEHRELVRQLAARGLEPQASWVADGNLDMRDRFVAWSRANRHLFE
jgi:aminoglycoside phosphotransferase (APT) family kinase protein